MAFIPNIPSSSAISEFDKAITELLRHGAGELSSRIQLLIEEMRLSRTEQMVLQRRIAGDLANFPANSTELPNAHASLQNIRMALARPDFRPG